MKGFKITFFGKDKLAKEFDASPYGVGDYETPSRYYSNLSAIPNTHEDLSIIVDEETYYKLIDKHSKEIEIDKLEWFSWDGRPLNEIYDMVTDYQSYLETCYYKVEETENGITKEEKKNIEEGVRRKNKTIKVCSHDTIMELSTDELFQRVWEGFLTAELQDEQWRDEHTARVIVSNIINDSYMGYQPSDKYKG